MSLVKVRRWCRAIHTFFFSCDEITVTLEDVANQLLLPILGDMDPNDIKLSAEEEDVEAELKKRMSGNAKLSHWVGGFSKASTAVRRVAFVTFWLSYCWVGLKPCGHHAVEFFDKGVGFSWRAYKDLGSGFTYANLAMGLLMAIARTTTLLIAFDKRMITYLSATNAGWLPSLANEGICYSHYSAYRVRRQLRLEQHTQ
ncbi:hypothetical protein SO802_015274 [Lithocarpus litseifolius]|uniref:Aminotransferase-like plant mobile domain-containing protein n=1 Tax=Lithocarpus litseifolius TaxID=425828 RepID=A0AAW2CVM2_9ROSI